MSNEMTPQQPNQLESYGHLPQDALQAVFRAYSMSNDWLLDAEPKMSDKNHLSRVRLYVLWLNRTKGHWTQPALAAYADYLCSEQRLDEEENPLEKLSPASIKSHLSTIRGRYAQFLRQPEFKAKLRQTADLAFPQISVAERRALTKNLLEDMEDALNPALVEIRLLKKQDEVDSEHIRLSKQQAESLMAAPDLGTYRGLRDAAVLVFLLCTGLREAELCQLDVRDLRDASDGRRGVRVREGKGAKQRFVPYGAMDFCLSYVDAWLTQAGIRTGAVFRGFRDRHLLDENLGTFEPADVLPRLTERLTTRAVQDILKQYPLMIDGELRAIRPHDTRRTYAKLCADMGMELSAIRDNLGHSDSKITQRYIGDADMEKRLAPELLRPQHDLKLLQKLGVQKLI